MNQLVIFKGSVLEDTETVQRIKVSDTKSG